MIRNDIRIMKMDRNNRSILMRALYADFCANREAGRPNEHYAALIIKVHNTPPGKLPLNGAEFRLARNSPNQAGEGEAAVLAVLVNGSPKSVQQQPGCNVRAVVGSGGLPGNFTAKVCWCW